MEQLLALERFQPVEFKIMAHSQEARQLKDYEILGIGASCREQILKAPGPFVLQLHPDLVPEDQKETYDLILAETLQWLKPASVQEVRLEKSSDEVIFKLMTEALKKEFPQTVQFLKSGAQEALQNYLQEFPWQGPLLAAHFRYFPVFLKRRFQDSRLYLIAQQEWLWSYLSFADFGFPVQEQGRIICNPSLQSLYMSSEIAELKKTQGLYILYYDYRENKVREHKLDVYEAAVVDMLQEDRKFTLDQLLDQLQMMDLEGSLTKEQWLKKFSSLVGEGIILESGLQRIANPKN
jgi:hypothetical protein